MNYISKTPEDTAKFAAGLAKKLDEGSVVALIGDLGAGKTVFVKGLADALNIKDYITSPTFNIVKEYFGDKKLFHFDVYRITDPDELNEIGFEEYIDSDAISVIEWADLIEELLPERTVYVKISGSGSEERVISLEGMEI